MGLGVVELEFEESEEVEVALAAEEEGGDIGEALLGALALALLLAAALAMALTPRTHLSLAAAGSPLLWLILCVERGERVFFFSREKK